MIKNITLSFSILLLSVCLSVFDSKAGTSNEAGNYLVPTLPTAFNDTIPVQGCSGMAGTKESSDCDKITGWAWCSSAPNNPVVIELYEDTIKIGEVLARDFRSDLQSSGKGNGKHGFTYYIPNILKDGLVHTVTMKFKGTSTVLTSGTFTINCTSRCSSAVPPPVIAADKRTVKPGEYARLTAGGCAGNVRWSTGQTGNSIYVFPGTTKDYSATCQVDECVSNASVVTVLIGTPAITSGSGNIESSNCELIAGWAWNSSYPNNPVIVELYDGTVKIAEGFADVFRQDLKDAGQGNGMHGFSIPIPDYIKDYRSHTLNMKIKGASANLPNSNRSYLCSPACFQWVEPPTVVASVKTTANGNNVSGTIVAGTPIKLTAGNCDGLILWSTGETGTSITVTPTANKEYAAICKVNECLGNPTYIQLQTVATTTSGANGTLEHLTCDQMGGWAYLGGASTNNTVIVEIYEGSTKIREFYADQFRSDLKNAGLGNGNHGFNFPLPAEMRTGQSRTFTFKIKGTSYTLLNGTRTFNCAAPGNCSSSVDAPTLAAAERTVLPGEPISLMAGGCSGTVTWSTGQTGDSISVSPTATTTYTATCTVGSCTSAAGSVKVLTGVATATGSVQGGIEFADCAIIKGWAASSSFPNNPIIVELYDGNVKITETFADGYRSDLPGNGSHGFYIAIPPQLKDRTNHTLNVKIKGLSANLSNGNRVLLCEPACNNWLTPPSITPSARSLTNNQGHTTTMNLGDSLTLTAGNCNGTIFWSNGMTGNSIVVKPVDNIDYTAICMMNNCLGNSSVIKVLVNKPTGTSPAGQVEGFNCTALTGWALFNSAKNNPVVVELYEGSTKLAQAIADGFRQDLKDAGQGNGYHAFYLPVPLSIKNGVSHSLSLKIAGTSYTLVNGTGNLTCASPCSTYTQTAPYIDVSKNDLCQGESAVLTAIGCTGVVNWSNLSVGTSITVAPSENTNYSAVCNINGCVSPAATVTVRASRPKVPVITVSSTSLCAGSSLSLTATNCDGTVHWSSGQTGSSVNFIPTATATYRAVCKQNTCTSDTSNFITVNVKPKPVASAGSDKIITCANPSVVLDGTSNLAGSTFSWTGPSGATFVPSNQANSPSVNKLGTYTLTVSLNGCSSTDEVVVTENKQMPTVALNTPAAITCANTSSTITATASPSTGIAYSWSYPAGGTNPGNVASFSRSLEGSYTVTVTRNDNGCMAMATATVSKNITKPTISFNIPSVLTCSNTTATITATSTPSTGVTYAWQVPSGATNPGNVASFSASKEGNYILTVTRTDNGCTESKTITILKNDTKPVISLGGNKVICQGDSVILNAVITNATGTETFSWSPATGLNKVNAALVKSGTQATRTHQVTVMNPGNGCSQQGSVTVTVKPRPATPVVSTPLAVICRGDSVTLNSNCPAGDTTLWSGGVLTTKSSIKAAPTSNQSYSAQCIKNGCLSLTSNSLAVTVNATPGTPTLQMTNASSICLGATVNLTAQGCSSDYLWNTTASTSGSQVFEPNQEGQFTYSVNCRTNNCVGPQAKVVVTVAKTPAPVITKISDGKSSYCTGDSVRISASSCTNGTIQWSTAETGSFIYVKSASAQIKNISAKCVTSTCMSDASNVIAVNFKYTPQSPVPSVPASLTICSGSSVNLSVPATPESVVWQPGNLSGASITVSPSTNTSYYAVYRSGDNCESKPSTSVNVVVKEKPGVVTLTSSKPSLCKGDSVMLSATGCSGGVVHWFPGNLTGVLIKQFPTTNTQYKVVCIKNDCSSDTARITIPVTSPVSPFLSATKTTVDANDETIITASGCNGVLKWVSGNGTSDSVITVRPLVTTDYSAYCEFNNCSSEVTKLRIYVNGTWPPIVQVMAHPQPQVPGSSKRIVRIRWAPNTAQAWLQGNNYGYKLRRFDLSSPGNPYVDLIPVALKPKPASAWPQTQAEADAQPQRATIGAAIWPTPSNNMETDTTSGIQPDNDDGTNTASIYYVMALMAADLDFKSARDAALGFIDSTALNNKLYKYQVYSEVPANVLTIDSSSDTISTIGTFVLDSIPKPKGNFGDRQVQIQWPADSLAPYIAYYVQRSENGTTYTTVNPTPISEVSGDGAPNAPHFYVDSLPQNNKDYYYRIVGQTPLDERTYSLPIVGQGRKANDVAVIITRSELLTKKSAGVMWGYVPAYSDSAYTNPSILAGYNLAKVEIQKSDKDDGPYSVVKTYTGANLYTTKDSVSNLTRSTYLRIVAYTNYQDTLFSMPVLLQPIDETPPQVPGGLSHTFIRGGALGDSLVVVKLTWTPNTEPDLGGYSLFRSYLANEEPVIILGDSLITTFQDTVSLRTMNEYIYYRISASDTRFNESEVSAPYRVKKPDVIPPSSPVFKNYSISATGVRKNWANPLDKDLASILLVRRSLTVTNGMEDLVMTETDTSWKVIDSFEGASIDTTYLDAFVLPDQAYAYALIAEDSSGLQSEPSIPLIVQVPITMVVRGGIGTLTPTPNYTLGRIRLSWQYSAPEGVDVRSFQIYRSEGEGSLVFWKNADGDDKLIDDYGIKNQTEYKYAIRVLFSDGTTSSWTNATINYVKPQ